VSRAVCSQDRAGVRGRFCDGWESFRPDPAWPIPTLPD
jgi:hypothetical protein